MKNFTKPIKQSRTLMAAYAVVLLTATAVYTAIGCGWSFENQHSVRFTGYNSTGEFTRLPSIPPNGSAPQQEITRNDNDALDNKFESQYALEEELKQLWERAGEEEGRNDYASLAGSLRKYLKLTSTYEAFNLEVDQRKRNSAIDRLDALTSLSHGAGTSSLASYLKARREYDDALLAETDPDFTYQQPGSVNATKQSPVSDYNAVRELLNEVPNNPALADNVSYLRAAILYREGLFDEAAKAFNRTAEKYPGGEKREAALLMSGLSSLHMFKQALEEADNAIDRKRPTARDAARKAFLQCIREYPNGRYKFDARGWLANLSLVEGNRAAALAEYYRLFNDGAETTKQSALISISHTRHTLNEEDLNKLEEDLSDEPQIAMLYIYLSIYDYSPNAGYYEDAYPKWESGDTTETYAQKEKRGEKILEDSRLKELARIASFAEKLMKRYPRTAIGGGFALRMAEANLELGRHQEALRLASVALQSGVKGRPREESLWVKGSSQYHLRDYPAARLVLQQLIREFPKSDLVEGSRRLIAVAAEDMGDIDAALEQYIDLDYKDDIAYFIDVLMTAEQLQSFIDRHPDSRIINELNYGLAIRYLRLKRWDASRSALARVRVTESEHTDIYNYDREDCGDPIEYRSKCRTPKSPPAIYEDNNDTSGIAARWLLRDRKTIDDLERLDHAVIEAKGDEEKAEAMYRMAGYLFQGSSLLFYNPSLWDGSRHYKLEALEYSNAYRAPNEAQILWSHMQEHEPVAQALEIYLEVARRYPNTRAGRDALYTTAVCHERLSDYNTYWRNIYNNGLHAGNRMVSYQDVRTAYPRYRLPRGTYGWEPLTRTVYGGPGWDAPPKPKPRPTFKQRLKTRFSSAMSNANEKFAHAIQYLKGWTSWVVYGLAALIIVLICYLIMIIIYTINQRPPDRLSLFEEHDISSRVERIINCDD